MLRSTTLSLAGLFLLLNLAAPPAQAQRTPSRHALRVAAGQGQVVGIPATSLGGGYSYYLAPHWSIGADALWAHLSSGNRWLDGTASGRAWVGQLHTTVSLLQGPHVGLELCGGGYYLRYNTRYVGFNSLIAHRTRQEVGMLTALRPTLRCGRWLTVDAGPEVRLSPSLRKQQQIGHTTRALFVSVSAQVAVGVQVRLP